MLINYKPLKNQLYISIIGLILIYVLSAYNAYYYSLNNNYIITFFNIIGLLLSLYHAKTAVNTIYKIKELTISIKHLIISYYKEVHDVDINENDFSFYISQLNEINKVIRINIDLSHLNLYPHKEELNLSLYVYRKLGYFVCITD